MLTALNDSSRDRVLMMLAFAVLAPCAFAQGATPAKLSLNTGKEIYEAACIACHGPNGKGMPDTTVGFDKPVSFPDFSRYDQTTPELPAGFERTDQNQRNLLGSFGLGLPGLAGRGFPSSRIVAAS